MQSQKNKVNKSPLNILIIGTGMYVCGRGTGGYGTILPALYEWKRLQKEGNVYIAGTRPEGTRAVQKKISELNELFGFELNPIYFPGKTINPEAYKDAIQQIPKPACAIVVVPDNLHREIAEETIKNKMHTLVVKPLAPTVKEVLELIELQEQHGVYCAVEFHKRYDRSNLKLKDAIASGSIGDPLYFVVEYSQRKSIPSEKFKSWVETTNVFQYLGVHYLDIIYYSTRALPLRVMAIGQKNYLLNKGIDTYDSIQAVIEWEMPSGNKFTSSLFTNWIDPEETSAMSNQMIKVVGTKGRYEADQKKRGISITTDESGIEEPNPDFCSVYGTKKGSVSFKGYGIDSIIEFLKDVTSVETEEIKCDDLQGERPTFKESLIPTIIIEAVNKSLDGNGQWIYTRSKNGTFQGFE